MELASQAAFVAVVALGAYVQTVTGFALGLIVMGTATLLNLAPIAFSAIVVSLASVVNIAIALRNTYQQIDRRALTAATLGVAPALLLGLWLLEQLSTSSAETLKAILGLFILVAGTTLMLRPQPRARRSGHWADFSMGFAGGLFGGLFSTAGPPLVYHLYREPLSIPMVKATLLAIFGFTTIGRNLYVAATGELTLNILTTAALCLPAVYLATLAGERFPPRLSENGMRRLAFGLLTLLGVTLTLGH